MMKYILMSFCMALIFSSCTIYEDVYFTENGSVKYDLQIELGQGVGGADIKLQKFGSYSLPVEGINLGQMIKDSLPNLSSEFDGYFANIAPLTFTATDSDDGSGFSINGTFNSVAKFNDALDALYILEQQQQKITKMEAGSAEDKFSLNMKNSFSWNGNVMQRKFENENNLDIDESTNTKFKGNGLVRKMLGPGVYSVRYHFPVAVSHCSDKNAKISEDNKVVTIEYPGLTFLSALGRDVDIWTDQH